MKPPCQPADRTTNIPRCEKTSESLKSMGFRLLKVSLLICSIVFVSPEARAWDFRIGYHYLMPKLGVHSQTYTASSGDKLTFTPAINKTITGNALSLGIGFERFSVNVEQSAFGYDTMIPESNDAVTTDTNATCSVTERRIGVSYHLDRDLAGLLIGVGMTSEQEEISTNGASWTYETITPFAKIGIDIIFGSLRFRYRQLHFGLGNHSVKINSLGVLLYF